MAAADAMPGNAMEVTQQAAVAVDHAQQAVTDKATKIGRAQAQATLAVAVELAALRYSLFGPGVVSVSDVSR